MVRVDHIRFLATCGLFCDRSELRFIGTDGSVGRCCIKRSKYATQRTTWIDIFLNLRYGELFLVQVLLYKS
jgi:hypothetical protein